MHISFQFDFDAVVDPNLHQKRKQGKEKGKQGQRRQRKPSVASLAKEPASRQASESLRVASYKPACASNFHWRLNLSLYPYPKQASPALSRHQNPAERSLKHALLVELLLKLRRGEVQLQVLPYAPIIHPPNTCSHTLTHREPYHNPLLFPHTPLFF